jgi:uncharacterized protein
MLLLMSLLAVPMAATAVRLDHLFEAEVDATGRDTGARDAALAGALEQVLVRLTGSRAALQGAAGAGLLEQPGRFVEQFRFVEPSAGDTLQSGLKLWAQFDGVSLARELRQAGLPYWGPERPDVLVWLAIDDRGRRYLASETGAQPVTAMLQQAGQQYGVPLTLPLMDLEDQRAVEFTDVWGRFSGRVELASQRYRPQAILTARLERSSAAGGWRADWQLINGANRQDWSTHAGDMDSAVSAGIADAAEWLAQRYAVVASAAGTHSLVVEDVRNLDDYARVYDYLAALSPVDHVDVLHVGQHAVEFNLTLSADERNLLQLIALGRVLQRMDDPAVWRFHLQP